MHEAPTGTTLDVDLAKQLASTREPEVYRSINVLDAVLSELSETLDRLESTVQAHAEKIAPVTASASAAVDGRGPGGIAEAAQPFETTLAQNIGERAEAVRFVIHRVGLMRARLADITDRVQV